MIIQMLTLTLHCRKSIEVIKFSSQVTHIHGQISAGKSSILRLIDYCLGGSLEKTPAIAKELISVQLLAIVEKYNVLFERQVSDLNEVRVTWHEESGDSVTLLVPIKIDSDSKPIWDNEIYNISDLLFYLFGMAPIKVRKSKLSDESPLIRLSFRDIMWYCYLSQDIIDSSFYRLEDPFKRLKSRDAIRFITGFYTERMNDLEIQLDEIRRERLAKEESAKQIRSFLENFGYGTETEITDEIALTGTELKNAKQELANIREKQQDATHFADELREKLRELSEQLAIEEETISDLNKRIEEQESLKAELITSKFKLARTEKASEILSGVTFEFCPECGMRLKGRPEQGDKGCKLCGSYKTVDEESIIPKAEIINRDLDAKIEDLKESIERHIQAFSFQERIVKEAREKKAIFDAQLTSELASYDSAFLARFREIERRIATLEEKKRNLEKVVKMPQAISQLITQATELRYKAEEIVDQIKLEMEKLYEAENIIKEIENVYLESLFEVGIPGMASEDKVRINRKTWIPSIISVDGDAYTFYDAGSLGKKTLMNVCYALSVHSVATEHNLPLPTLLMIDTPMKNIGEDVNEDIFRAFYKYLYKLSRGLLSKTQLIIIDKEFFPPEPDLNVNIVDRFMSPQKPLISYYHGP